MNILLAFIIASAPVDPRFTQRYLDATNACESAKIYEAMRHSMSNRHQRIKKLIEKRRQRERGGSSTNSVREASLNVSKTRKNKEGSK